MTSSSTIIGITRKSRDNSPQDDDIGHVDTVSEDIELMPDASLAEYGKPLVFGTTDTEEPLILNDQKMDDEQYLIGDIDALEDGVANWRFSLIPSSMIAAFAVWTVFFGWVHYAEDWTAISGERFIALVGNWTVPAMFIALVWLLVLRSSRSEANRFNDVAHALRTESEALEVRMRTVNEEIAMARAFLAQNARELESVGRQSASKLMEAAQQLGAALADSDAKAKTLEEVSSAAATNLEQLRKHLPVVTSAAKDVTNQIGSAGNSAQLQVKTLIAGLQRVADAGTSARENIEGLEVRAGEAAVQLAHILSQSAGALETSVSNATVRAADIANILSDAHTKIADGLGNANEDVTALVDINLAKLTQQVEMLRESLSGLRDQSVEEDNRVSAIITRVSSHIADRAQVLAELDTASTDRTVKLAFAVEALVSSTHALNEGLTESGRNTEHLSQQSDVLLTALTKAKQELDVGMPEAMTRTEEKLLGSLSHIQIATNDAISLDDTSDELLIKLATIQKLIASQNVAVASLLNSSDDQFALHQEHIDALAAALVQTRAMMEQLAETANDGLVTALHQVRDSTQEAAEASRMILDDEMSNVAARLTKQSRDALSSAIEGQVETLNEMVQKSFEDNLGLSQRATTQITLQLAEIDSLTNSLEARLATAREGFSGLDEDSFARQMVTLTESLNSTAIDVAKILSNEVTDVSWAAYLKGDRGVFTRRAVRLLDAGEAKAILTYYSDDNEFREHVNRYIHDFESMMRVLLSTRDGNAIGVTLLSSDVGKLYVALAQAIERLRN
jgi:hypothetical protein